MRAVADDQLVEVDEYVDKMAAVHKYKPALKSRLLVGDLQKVKRVCCVNVLKVSRVKPC